MVKNSSILPEILTSLTRHPHPTSEWIHRGNGEKVKATYKKTDGSPNAQAQALLQLHDTPLASDLPSLVEILHGWPAQGAVIPHPHRPVNMQRICRWLLEIQNTQKEHFNQAHRAKDKRILKVREQVLSKQTIQHEVKLVDRDSERNIGMRMLIHHWRPKWKQYRRNRAHLKPICHDSSSFQDPPKVKKKNLRKSDNVDSFQDPRLKPKKKVMFNDSTTVIPLFEHKDSADKTSDSTSSSSNFHPVHPHHHHLHSPHPERN